MDYCWPAAKNSKDFHIDHDQSLKAPKIVNVFQSLRAAKNKPWSVAKKQPKNCDGQMHLGTSGGVSGSYSMFLIYGDLSIWGSRGGSGVSDRQQLYPTE